MEWMDDIDWYITQKFLPGAFTSISRSLVHLTWVGICRIWSFVGIFKYIGLHLQYLSGPYEHSRGIIMGFLLHLHRRLSEPLVSCLGRVVNCVWISPMCMNIIERLSRISILADMKWVMWVMRYGSRNIHSIWWKPNLTFSKVVGGLSMSWTGRAYTCTVQYKQLSTRYLESHIATSLLFLI